MFQIILQRRMKIKIENFKTEYQESDRKFCLGN